MRSRNAGVRSAKEECLSKLILFGEGSLKRALAEFLQHFHAERPHQGKEMCFCSQLKVGSKQLVRKLCASSGSAACFDTTVVPHDFLDLTGSRN